MGVIRQEDLRAMPWNGDRINCRLPYRAGRMTGTVTDTNHPNRIYVVEFEGKAGKFKIAYKLGGDLRSMYKSQQDGWNYFHPPKPARGQNKKKRAD